MIISNMISDKYISFDEIIDTLKELEREVNLKK